MNKKRMVLCLMAMACVLTFSTQTERTIAFDNLYHFIEDLDVFEYGQEEARAYYIPEHHVLLNGRWKFCYADTPQEIPENFFEEKFSDAKWGTIDVPSNWEMRGFGDALFRNVAAPFKADPPKTPRDYNPTGAYRTTFTIPADWNGEEVFLRFEKVASASFLWVNGQEVGYNEGAQEPAEYNITKYLKKGRNTLAMKVVKYSDGFIERPMLGNTTHHVAFGQREIDIHLIGIGHRCQTALCRGSNEVAYAEQQTTHHTVGGAA